MNHVAIMRKSWGLLPKILSGEKTIESRWYKNKSAPWGKIKAGDTVYFKNSGELVSVRVRVRKVLEFENLTLKKVREILDKYGKEIGMKNIEASYELYKNKRYCILVFLGRSLMVDPFRIDKTGFGMEAAWICVENIKSILHTN